MNIGQKTSTALLWFALLIIGCISCKKAQSPIVETSQVRDITEYSAISGGKVLDDGGAEIIEKGVCWKKGAEATITDNVIINSEGSLDFTSLITGLEDGSDFCVKAYAKNKEGIGYGKPVYFSTFPAVPLLSNVTISSVTANSVVLEGYLSWGKGLEVLSTGICYGRSPDPDLSNSYAITEVVLDTVKLKLTGMESNTIYYVRVCMVVRLKGTTNYYAVMGNVSSFRTRPLPAAVGACQVSNIWINSAKIEGRVINDGGAKIISRGICIGDEENPTTNNRVILCPGDTGVFKIELFDLTSGKLFNARAFAVNSEGTSYGDNVQFNTNYGIVSDISGNIYPTVKIGSQIWMKKHLRTDKLNDGTDIILAENNEIWSTPGLLLRSYHRYIPDTTYIYLYNGTTVRTNKLCPVGWHVPSLSDWEILFQTVGGISVAGQHLKESGTIHWKDNTKETDNLYGFTAFPGGYFNHGPGGGFFTINTEVGMWTSTEYIDIINRDFNYTIILKSRENAAIVSSSHPLSANYVRCLKNQ